MDAVFDEPQLRIVLHNSSVLHAPVYGVKCMSACACNLPAEAAEWDLSGLLIDGQPVSVDTVKAWLGAVYKQLGDGQYSLDLDTTGRTMEGLYQLLRFADAVGSRQGVLQACLKHVEELWVHLPCGDDGVMLIADGRVYCYGGALQLLHQHPIQGEQQVVAFSSTEAADTAKQALTTQLEQLLWLAHKGRVESLISALHTFIHSNVAVESGLLHGCLNHVFTTRVKEAALGTAQLSLAEDWINTIVAHPAAITQEQDWFLAPLLAPLDEEERAPAWEFRARLSRRYLGLPAGTEVDVRLDLAESVLHIGQVALCAQLLVGPAVYDQDDASRLMGE